MGQRVALRYASLPYERLSVVARRSGHHGQAAPVGCHKHPGVWADDASLYDLQAPGSVQGVDNKCKFNP